MPALVYDSFRRLITMLFQMVMEKAEGIEPEGERASVYNWKP
jgi:hypothetical protein